MKHSANDVDLDHFGSVTSDTAREAWSEDGNTLWSLCAADLPTSLADHASASNP